MKKPIFTLFLVVLVNLIFAQDVTTLNNGNELKVKILQITLSEITYKLYDNQSGPVVTLKLTEIKSFKYDDSMFKEQNRTDSIENILNKQNNIGTASIENPKIKANLKKDRKLSFGFSLGMDIANWWNSGKFVDNFHNVMAGNNIYLNVRTDAHIAFSVGFSVNYRIRPWLEMQTELNWLGKGQSCEGEGKVPGSSGAQYFVQLRCTWALNYLQLPLIMRFINKKGLFLAIGPHLAILTDAKTRLKIKSSTTPPVTGILTEIRPLNTGITAGGGIQTKWICVELRYFCDFLDLFKKGNYDFGVRNHVFQLNCSLNFGR